MTRWDVKPFIGLGPLKFGMSPHDVAAFNSEIGEIIHVDDMFGFRAEHRPYYTPKCEYKEEALVSIDTHRNEKFSIFFEDLDVYESDPALVIKSLSQRNGGAKSHFGSILFENLGINIRGFYLIEEQAFFRPDSSQDDRTLAIFSRGTLDHFLKECQPLVLPDFG